MCFIQPSISHDVLCSQRTGTLSTAASQHTECRRLVAGALCGAERSYPTSKVRGSGLECQAAMVQERPRGATLRPRSAAAERSYPVSEVSGCCREETPHVRGQGRRPRGATQRPRPVAARRRHPESEIRGGDLEEPPGARGQGRQLGVATHARGQGRRPGGATRGVVAAQAQEGLQELSHI